MNIIASNPLNFNLLASSLEVFIASASDAMHIKDADQGRYLLSNDFELSVYGFKKHSELLGLTLQDLDKFMNPYWGKAFVFEMESLDLRVKTQRETVVDAQRTFLDRRGLLRIQNIKKIPLLKVSGEVSSILTMSANLTQKYDDFELFGLYKQFYAKKHQAIFYFMKYFNLHQFFVEILTEKELLCLLHMKRDHTLQGISKGMFLALKILKKYINNIENKSKHGSVYHVLVFLRNHNGRLF